MFSRVFQRDRSERMPGEKRKHVSMLAGFAGTISIWLSLTECSAFNKDLRLGIGRFLARLGAIWLGITVEDALERPIFSKILEKLAVNVVKGSLNKVLFHTVARGRAKVS